MLCKILNYIKRFLYGKSDSVVLTLYYYATILGCTVHIMSNDCASLVRPFGCRFQQGYRYIFDHLRLYCVL